MSYVAEKKIRFSFTKICKGKENSYEIQNIVLKKSEISL